MKKEILETIKKIKEIFDLEEITDAEVADLKFYVIKLDTLFKNIENAQLKKAYDGIHKMFMNETNINKKEDVIRLLEAFEQAVEKNYIVEEINATADKLNSEFNNNTQLYTHIENLKYGLICRDIETISQSVYEIKKASDNLKKEEQERIVVPIGEFANELAQSRRKITDYSDEEIEKEINKINNIENIIDEISKNSITKSVEENLDEKPMPTTKEDIKKEMDELVDGSIFAGIEKFDFERKDLEIDAETKKRIKELQEEYEMYKLVNNDKKIEEIRQEIYLLAYPKFLALKFINSDKVTKLSDDKHKRLDNLLLSYDKIIKEEKEKRAKEKASKKTTTTEKTTEASKAKNNEALEGVVVTPTKKKKGKKVISAKPATEFYKKHKKGVQIALGITMLAVGSMTLLPTIMYLHSALWGVAVASGVPTTAALPTVLHNLNTIIGAKIGATYATSSGIWTLANGMALNATAAEAGILSTMGGLALIATPFVGAKMVIKNAIKVAKEKIAKRKEKIAKETPEKKGHFFRDIKDYVKNKINVIKEGVSKKYNEVRDTISTKYTETKQKVDNKYTEIKENYEAKKAEKDLERERIRLEREAELAKHIKNPYLSRKTNNLIQTLFDIGIIEQDTFDELKEVESDQEAYDIIKQTIKEEKGKGSK